jgi:hypothetical protein
MISLAKKCGSTADKRRGSNQKISFSWCIKHRPPCCPSHQILPGYVRIARSLMSEPSMIKVDRRHTRQQRGRRIANSPRLTLHTGSNGLHNVGPVTGKHHPAL